jgi:hypothetical protein
MDNRFLNKKVKLVLNSGFVLYGLVRDIDTFGITFETTQKTSYIAFCNIKEMSLDAGER